MPAICLNVRAVMGTDSLQKGNNLIVPAAVVTP